MRREKAPTRDEQKLILYIPLPQYKMELTRQDGNGKLRYEWYNNNFNNELFPGAERIG